MKKKELKKCLIAILELIEDKEFPARRNISDYVELIIGGLKPELTDWCQKICSDFYKAKDKKK